MCIVVKGSHITLCRGNSGSGYGGYISNDTVVVARKRGSIIILYMYICPNSLVKYATVMISSQI